MAATIPQQRDRPLPTGTKVAAILRHFWKRQALETMQRLRHGIPNEAPRLDHYTQPMVEALTPTLLPTFARAYRGQAVAIRRQSRRKSAASDLWAALHPRATEFLRRMVFDFCDETNQTTQESLTTAFRRLRSILRVGMEEGLSMSDVASAVGEVFQDPMRAMRIARTESSRAVHGGELLAARDSGVVSKQKWLASSDACDICQKLDGKEVGLDEDFAYHPRAPAAYAHVRHPPLHPNCRCTTIMIVDPEYL